MARSSECIWLPSGFNESKLIRSVELVNQVTIITPTAHKSIMSDSKYNTSTVSDLLKSIESKNVVSIPRNEEDDSFVLIDNVFWMLLTSQTFYSFGLPGVKYKKSNKYLCYVNLRENNNKLQRFWECVNNLDKKYMFVHSNNDVRFVDSKPSSCSDPEILLHSTEDLDNDLINDWFDEFDQWLGGTIFNYKHRITSADKLNHVSVMNGVYRSGEISDLWMQLKGENYPWLVMHVSGFQNVPVPYLTSKEKVETKLYQEVGYVFQLKQNQSPAGLKFVS